MATMIAHLNDNHVSLRSPSRRFGAGILQELHMEDFSLDLVKEKYLKGKALPLHDGKADIDAKRDRVLELAVALIESGARPAPRLRTVVQK